MSKVIPGGYELAPMNACALPEEVASGYTAVVTPLVGADYLPVLYVGRQTVAGVNYMIICKQTVAAADAPEHLVKVVLNSDLKGAWALLSIDPIV